MIVLTRSNAWLVQQETKVKLAIGQKRGYDDDNW